MTEILPFQDGMILGTTYDLRSHSFGLNSIPEEYTTNPQTVQCPSTIVKYQQITNSSDVNIVLGISQDISLKVKAGCLNVEPIGSYLRENRPDENALEILVIAHVETISTQLTNTHPVSNLNMDKMGTHYISRIIYGGDLIVSIRIIASDSKTLEEIKATFYSGLQTEGILIAEAKAHLRKMEQDLRDRSNIKVNYYSTIPGIQLLTDVDSILKALDDFQNQLNQINDGRGAPLRCELVPLTHREADIPAVLRQPGLDIQLRELEEMYDDIRQAKSMLQKSLEDAVNTKSNDQTEKGNDILGRMQKVMSMFDKVISSLDVTIAGHSLDEIQQAADYYRQNKRPGGFRTEVKMFIKNIKKHKAAGASRTPIKQFPAGESLSIILVGKAGHGKSATANSIFGEHKFQSATSSDSVSISCQMEISTIDGREICLVDTPGIMDLKYSDEALEQLQTAISNRSGGFHALLFVLNVDARFTVEEQNAIELLKKMFGDDIIVNYGIFVFTHGNSFTRNMTMLKEKTTFEEHIKSQSDNIQNVLRECNYRCTLIDNLEQDPGIRRDQVINIITLIDRLVANNDGKRYTKDIFEKAQKKLEEEQNVLDEKTPRHEGCFPADALITLDGGRTITMADLRTGEKVLSSAASGTLEYSEVYFFAHLNPNIRKKYIQLKSVKHALQLTTEHHLYIIRHGHMKTIAAREVKIGDNILVLNKSFSSFVDEPVTEISKLNKVGVYAPITMSGSIIVNNVFASCYVDTVPPVYSHLMLSPLRQLYRLSPSLASQINAKGKEGMPNWVQWIVDNLLE